MAGSEKEPDWKWGQNDHIDTANSVARLFEKEGQKSIKPLRTKRPEGYLDAKDADDTADAVEKYFGYHTGSGVPSFMTEVEGDFEVSPESQRISLQVQEFYHHCANQFFKHHYPKGYALDEISQEATRMALDYSEFRTNFANQLKEERVLVSDDNLRADILIDEMEFDELYQYASRMIDYCISDANKASKDGLEWGVLMNEGAFWDMVCAIIVCAKTLDEQGITRRKFE